MAVQSVTDADFETEVLRSKTPVVVDLYADWCGPCKAVAPVLEDLSGKYAGKVKFVKIDIERNPYVASAFRVQSIPMFAFVNDGKVAHIEVGALDRAAFEDIIGQVFPIAPGGVEVWDAMRVKLAIEAGLGVAIDLRAPVDHGRARLPGAVSMPLETVDEALPGLKDRSVRYVFYARSAEGVNEVAEKASTLGLKAVVLEGGMFGWEVAGLPVERGAAS